LIVVWERDDREEAAPSWVLPQSFWQEQSPEQGEEFQFQRTQQDVGDGIAKEEGK